MTPIIPLPTTASPQDGIAPPPENGEASQGTEPHSAHTPGLLAMASAEKGKLTPMFEQYLAIKADYPNALLFYRMGDFYELFFEDALTAAKELQITLTSRNPNAESPIPMAGVPHHAAENYLRQLNEKGYTVAICDQVSDPKASKGLVERAVTLVRTPGTAVEDASLEAKTNNYLGAVYWDSKKEAGGFVWLEYSTGAWSGLQTRKLAELWQWVQKMQPKELLLPDMPSEQFAVPRSMSLEGTSLVRLPVRSFFDLASSRERVLKAQGVQEPGAIGLNGKDELLRACGAMVGYLVQTQKQELEHLKPFAPMNLGRYLILDEITERNLEIFRRLDGKKGAGTLWHILDDCLTPMGGRLLEERLQNPWREPSRIRETAEAVQFFARDDKRRTALRAALERVYDLERLSTRIALGRTTPRDFTALCQSLGTLAEVYRVLAAGSDGYATDAEARGDTLPTALYSIFTRWDPLDDLASLLEKALVEAPPLQITEGGLFRAGYNQALDELLDLAEHGQERLNALLAEEQANNALPRLRLGFNKVFGYYFEMSRAAGSAAPAHFERRQTLANAERFVTPALKELETLLLSAGDKRNTLEYTLFQDLRAMVSAARPRILFMASAIAALDYWQSLASVARKNNWVRPELHDGTEVVIKEGRHPVVEALVGAGGFTPNDLRLDSQRRLLLITGPNMSGKSTVLRQMALIAILAQMGSFVPAAEARIGIVDRIFSRVGASDNLARGQSTFMVEMMETARILRQATGQSLVILDEIGRGTSTFDGLALAWAVAEDLLRRGDASIRTLFATHYHELTSLEGRLPGVHNMNIAIREWGGEIVFLHRLIPGPADKSYGIEVARLAGVPQPVVARAKALLAALDATRTTQSRETEAAMQQMLPGMAQPAPKKAPVPENPLQTAGQAPPHPVALALQDLDIDTLSPIKALTLLHEWKLLWGGNNE